MEVQMDYGIGWVEVYLPLSDGNRKYSTQNSTQLVVAAIT